jgi:hypothetical protein
MELLRRECTDGGGDFRGAGTLCSEVDCSVDTQACCSPAGNCTDVPRQDCIDGGGTPQGLNSDCETADCQPDTSGNACCFEDGTCQELSSFRCRRDGGESVPGSCTPEGTCPTP